MRWGWVERVGWWGEGNYNEEDEGPDILPSNPFGRRQSFHSVWCIFLEGAL